MLTLGSVSKLSLLLLNRNLLAILNEHPFAGIHDTLTSEVKDIIIHFFTIHYRSADARGTAHLDKETAVCGSGLGGEGIILLVQANGGLLLLVNQQYVVALLGL